MLRALGIEQHSRHLGEDAGSPKRQHAPGVQDAGVAVGTAAPRLVAIDERHGMTFTPQRERAAHTDNAGAEDGERAQAIARHPDSIFIGARPLMALLSWMLDWPIN